MDTITQAWALQAHLLRKVVLRVLHEVLFASDLLIEKKKVLLLVAH